MESEALLCLGQASAGAGRQTAISLQSSQRYLLEAIFSPLVTLDSLFQAASALLGVGCGSVMSTEFLLLPN